MNTKWIQLTVTTSEALVDLLSNRLIELGSQGTMIEDHPEHPDWCQIRAYYPYSSDAADLIRQIEHYLDDLQELGEPVGRREITSAILDDRDWSTAWKQYFKPARIGKRVVIKPSWEPFQVHPTDIVIEIDPGMAFGTGLHASTRLAIALLEHYLRPGSSVLDVGVGSGILTLVAARLGAEYVLGVDVDAEAVAIARENVRKNSLAFPQQPALHEGIELEVGSIDTLPISTTFECIVMNIRPNIILPLISYAATFLETGGALIISGILEEEGPDLVNEIHNLDFLVQNQLIAEGWIAYVLSHVSSEPEKE